MGLLSSGDLFIKPREPEEIIAEAMSHGPVAIYAAFSGGDTSLATAHWMMNNVPGCRVFHANTGIGIEAAREFVRETCKSYQWPLDEIRAKEDCGQDYREMVLKHGFPGPAMHHRMYARLKERPVRLLVKRAKQKRRDKVMIATGIYKEESQIRMGYGERNINFVGSQMWVNPFYWWPKQRFMDYLARHGIKRSPVAKALGMSGECLCGAHAHPGGKAYHAYNHEMTADQHRLLLERIVDCRAAVVLSGYPSEIYDERLGSWKRVEIAAHADGALDRTEVLWINPKCATELERRALPLLHHLEAAE